MNELIKKEKWSDEELSKLDSYYDQHIEEVLELENKDIIRLIDSSEQILGYSLLKISLEYYILDIAITAYIIFDEESLNEYLKYDELISYFNFDEFGLTLALGDYYFNIDKKKSYKLYNSVFEGKRKMRTHLFIDSLKKYIELVKDPIKTLIYFLKVLSDEDVPSLDYVNTYLILINYMDEKDSRYLGYIEEAIKISKIVVDTYRKDYSNIVPSDSDEERALCELLSRKLEYYVNKKDYIEAYKMYTELTNEIAKSDCTRYYHFRDKCYYQMISYMSEEYPDLKFFEHIHHEKFEVLEPIENINDYLKKRVTLKNSQGMIYRFKIIYIHKDYDLIIVPLLPLLGEGGYMYVTLLEENGKISFSNKL